MAYQQGAFPMADDSGEIEFYGSRQRALFPIEGIRVSRSMAKVIRRGDFEITFDHDFRGVMAGCADRPEGSWINHEIKRAFVEVHELGWAHSCEAWRGGELAGGVYGVALGGFFGAESMFHRQTNASKAALHAMVQECRRQGFLVFDAQIMNPHLASLGAFEVSTRRFEAMLAQALRVKTRWGLDLSE
jgi:leucyl/phenylalanyl-tRNA--protein transferase